MAFTFINRRKELAALTQIAERDRAQILVVYGRRRVGKTALIEHLFAKRNLLKFEGLEGQSKSAQIREFLRILFNHTKNELLLRLEPKSWSEALELLTKYTKKGECTLYFEELQWLAADDDELVSAIKSFWDNQWRHNSKLLLILCGSSPSFMIHRVLHSKALYNRSEIDFPLAPFSLASVREYLGQNVSLQEAMDAMLSVGGIPPYLDRLKGGASVYTALVNESFRPRAYFSTEYERIFTSSLAKRKDYRVILEMLSTVSYLDRREIAKKLEITAGGSLSELLEDLELSNFITSYSPVGKETGSKLKRYAISDPYIRFYSKHIKPQLRKISEGAWTKNSERALPMPKFRIHLGFGFERWVLSKQHFIAELLGFSGIDYASGPYFSRGTPGTQIDLVYERRDRVSTLVEIRYTATPVGPEAIAQCQRKEALYPQKGKSIQRVLVSAAGATPELLRRGYFDQIITLDDLAET